MVKLTDIAEKDGYRAYTFNSKLDLSGARKQAIIQLAAEKGYIYDDSTKTLKVGGEHPVDVAEFNDEGFRVLKAVENAITPAITSVLYNTNFDDLLLRYYLLEKLPDYRYDINAGQNGKGLEDKLKQELEIIESRIKIPELVKKYEHIKKAYETILTKL